MEIEIFFFMKLTNQCVYYRIKSLISKLQSEGENFMIYKMSEAAMAAVIKDLTKSSIVRFIENIANNGKVSLRFKSVENVGEFYINFEDGTEVLFKNLLFIEEIKLNTEEIIKLIIDSQRIKGKEPFIYDLNDFK